MVVGLFSCAFVARGNEQLHEDILPGEGVGKPRWYAAAVKAARRKVAYIPCTFLVSDLCMRRQPSLAEPDAAHHPSLSVASFGVPNTPAMDTKVDLEECSVQNLSVAGQPAALWLEAFFVAILARRNLVKATLS